ncbi:shikimate dehydrogenase [Notoacmeibacter sp. MSK16QG-6]|uniref:shikimate dehydrogenase family protein n=1 Tax=Notoacmeibacter sp. MSK16QG-6 TaxID=2957982 RepID=UPI0020A0856A|nr:shikimate dehydrogenase [Notoacmeibacter sp. MSK16QG-6]MCP1198330.1 shikimate dehydrogenase [Notoacmeibacter sp. MSK16QG-6]
MLKAQLDGETVLFPIAGDPIAQVKSPPILTNILTSRGLNAMVVPMHVAPADFAAFVALMARIGNVGGLIATVPHKRAALEACDEPSERASFAGSVNVMRKTADGRWIGDNTDGHGYMQGVAERGFDIRDKRALLVGVGGAGSAIAFEILDRGAAHLAIHDVDEVRRDEMIARLEQRFPGRVGIGSPDPTGFDFVGNATPVGMKNGDPMPIDAEKYVASQFVADSITKPEVTPHLQIARQKGCAVMPGIGMLDAQAELLVDVLTGQNLN